MHEGSCIRPKMLVQHRNKTCGGRLDVRRLTKALPPASDRTHVGYCWIYAVDARASIAGGGASSCAASRPFSKYNTRGMLLARL